jgi:cation diffusion facilitator CzcD-associated flavoprotein CzcO
LNTKEKICETFDFVVVCTSYPSTPFVPPEIPGIEDLEVRVVHSHDLRNEFR